MEDFMKRLRALFLLLQTRVSILLTNAAASFASTQAMGLIRKQRKSFDTIIRGGMVYDGTGGKPRRADVGIVGDRIEAIGNLANAEWLSVVDARGLAVAPGFINMLSWSVDTLLIDGRSQGEIRQGVTTQIFGEGDSMGPLTDEMKKRRLAEQGDIKFEIPWTTLSEYLVYLEKRGVSQMSLRSLAQPPFAST